MSHLQTNQRLIAIIFDHYGPYHLARLKGAQAVLGREAVVGVQVHGESAEYSWRVDANNAHAVGVQTIIEEPNATMGRWARSRAVWRFLERLRPTAVAIAGYSGLEMLTSLIWCRVRGRRAILFSDSKEDDAIRTAGKEWLKSLIVRQFDAAIVGGEPHIRYLVKLGFPRSGIFTPMACVGNDDLHPNRTQDLPRPAIGPYFLLINRFVAKKNLPFVLECYAEYRKRLSSTEIAWELVLAGDGALRDQLVTQCRTSKIDQFVHFPGFLQQDALLRYLAGCEVFIHASTTEQWGLVINEAMAAGRPVFVSRKCGCFEDLIIEGRTGIGFDPTSVDELVTLMLAATTGDLPLQQMGQAALDHIDRYSPPAFGRAVSDAIGYVS